MNTEDFKRKLTAILSADVVGYSRLMGDDETATVKTLETYKGVMFSLIRQHRGRVVDSPGDNLLAEFGSVVDAVQCAVSIQKELQTRNADLSQSRRMEFRIGINLGDVIEEDDRIYGDGVNIAARLEALADPGGICISKTAFDYIENKLPFGYRFIGEQTVKNIAKPVGAYKVLMDTRVIDEEEEQKAKAPFWRRKAVLSLGIIVILAIVAVLYWNFYPRGPSIEPASIEPEQVPAVSEVGEAPKTIAVLPFTDLSPEKDQEYFVDGLSEELINCLTKIGDLRVIARTSSFAFKDTKKTVQEIADALGADHVLEGSVRKAGNELRITAQLIQAVDSIHLWSDTYDRELKDIFEIQEDIAKAVADELKVTLGIGKSLKQLGGTDNVVAYELYLVAKGMYNDLGMDQAQQSIDAAITLDPEFGLAWVLKANIHMTTAAGSPPESVATEQDAALQAAQRAIEIEPNLAEAYAALGEYRNGRGDLIGAESANLKALELTNKPWSIGWQIGLQYLTVGYLKRANEQFEAVRRNDPFNELNRTFYINSIGCLGDMQRAEKEYERCIALFGAPWDNGNWSISFLRLGTGDFVSGDDIPHSNLIFDTLREHIESQGDALAEFHQIYNDDDSLTTANFADMSVVVSYLGDSKFAMDAMEKAYSIDNSRTWFIWFPVMHEVRQLPQFKEFVREIGLVDFWNKFGWPDICRPLENGDFVCD